MERVGLASGASASSQRRRAPRERRAGTGLSRQRGCARSLRRGRGARAAPRLPLLWCEEWLHGGWHPGTAPPAPRFPAAQLVNPRVSSGWRGGGEQRLTERAAGMAVSPASSAGSEGCRWLRFTHRAGDNCMISSHFWDVLRKVLRGSGGADWELGAAQLGLGGAALGRGAGQPGGPEPGWTALGLLPQPQEGSCLGVLLQAHGPPAGTPLLRSPRPAQPWAPGASPGLCPGSPGRRGALEETSHPSSAQGRPHADLWQSAPGSRAPRPAAARDQTDGEPQKFTGPG